MPSNPGPTQSWHPESLPICRDGTIPWLAAPGTCVLAYGAVHGKAEASFNCRTLPSILSSSPPYPVLPFRVSPPLQQTTLLVAMDWHNTRCRNLNEARIGDLISCLSCGSVYHGENPPKIRPQAPEAAFQYPPIRQRTQFRLLWVQPGEFDTPLQCEIVTGSVDEAVYEAISYTWADETGDTSKCNTIFLNSVPFHVTQNCEMALKRVRARYMFTKSCIWVDAIYIDQTNPDERGHQVRLMPLIYSRAKAVLVYIGESTHRSSWVLRILESGTLHRDAHVATLALRDLFARRYFSRVWVLQEVALARQSVLICGDTTIPWKFFRPEHLQSLDLLRGNELRLNGSQLPPVLYFDHSVYTRPNQLMKLLDFASNCQA